MKIRLILLLLMVPILLNAAFKAPARVTDAFMAKYPNAAKLKWSKEGPGKYEVNFVSDSSEMSCVMDKDGNIIETEREIYPAKLPQNVISTIKGKIKKAFEIKNAEGKVTYEVELIQKGRIKEYLFDETGKRKSIK